MSQKAQFKEIQNILKQLPSYDKTFKFTEQDEVMADVAYMGIGVEIPQAKQPVPYDFCYPFRVGFRVEKEGGLKRWKAQRKNLVRELTALPIFQTKYGLPINTPDLLYWWRPLAEKGSLPTYWWTYDEKAKNPDFMTVEKVEGGLEMSSEMMNLIYAGANYANDWYGSRVMWFQRTSHFMRVMSDGFYLVFPSADKHELYNLVTK